MKPVAPSLPQRLFASVWPQPRLTVLIFHRVLAAPDPLFPHEIDRARFDEVCGWLGRWFQVLPLDAAVQALQAGTLPERALSITFDDGYADNHDIALPVLQRHGLHATFFVATGFLDGGCMWNDWVVEAVRRCPAAALDLSGLPLQGLPAQLALCDTARRQQAIAQLLRAIKYLPADQRGELAAELGRRAGVSKPPALMMRSEQVRALSEAGMGVGAHTVSHPILRQLDDAAALAEMGGSKQALESITGRAVELFAYPNGRPHEDFDARIAGLVREAGFKAAVTTSWGAAAPGADLFQIPRVMPWDRTAPRFLLRLWCNAYFQRIKRVE